MQWLCILITVLEEELLGYLEEWEKSVEGRTAKNKIKRSYQEWHEVHRSVYSYQCDYYGNHYSNGIVMQGFQICSKVFHWNGEELFFFTLKGVKFFLSKKNHQDPLEKFFFGNRGQWRGVKENTHCTRIFLRTHRHWGWLTICVERWVAIVVLAGSSKCFDRLASACWFSKRLCAHCTRTYYACVFNFTRF